MHASISAALYVHRSGNGRDVHGTASPVHTLGLRSRQAREEVV